ncbi:hypothetical protein [Thalassotalea ganghwensis]
MSEEGKKQMANSPLEQLTDDDLDWQNLSSDWQSQPFQKTDISALIKQTRRRVIWAKSLLVIDIVSTLSLIIMFFAGLWVLDWSFATLCYVAFGSVFSVIFCIYTVSIRLKAWRQMCQSPDKALENAIANCLSSVKYMKVCKLSVYILFPVVNWYIYELSKIKEVGAYEGYAYSNILLLSVWGIFEYYYRKSRTEYIHLSSLQTK